VIQSHEELEVYQMAFETAMRVFESKAFPREETYSLTDQIRRSSRSVCSNIAEAWRKRRYEAAFVSKLNDAESEAAETQTWIQFAVECNYWTDVRSAVDQPVVTSTEQNQGKIGCERRDLRKAAVTRPSTSKREMNGGGTVERERRRDKWLASRPRRLGARSTVSCTVRSVI